MAALAVSVAILSSCADKGFDASTDTTDYSGTESIIDRLNSANEVQWEPDKAKDLTGSQSIAVYLTDECGLWVFEDINRVNTLIAQDFFSWFEGSYWYGEDGLSSNGVVLLAKDRNSRCAISATKALNWKSLADSEDTTDVSSEPYSSISGTYGTDAYDAGFEGSYGASQALIESFGGLQSFCENLLPLHPEYDEQEQADYVLGCIDANS